MAEIDIKYTWKILTLIIKKDKKKGNNFSTYQINIEKKYTSTEAVDEDGGSTFWHAGRLWMSPFLESKHGHGRKSRAEGFLYHSDSQCLGIHPAHQLPQCGKL